MANSPRILRRPAPSDAGAAEAPVAGRRPSANLTAGDGYEERPSRSEQRTGNDYLTGKAPYKFESPILQRRVRLASAFHGCRRKDPAFAECEPRRDQRTGRVGHEPVRLGCFSLTGIDVVPLGKSKRATRKAQALAWTHSVEGRSSVRQETTLIGPVERQIEFGKTRRSEFDGLSALQDRLDQLGAQKSEVDEALDIATSDAVALGQFPQRSGASGGKLFEPRPPAGDRLDQRGVTSGAVVLLWEPRQHQPHFDTTAPEGHRRCKLDWAVARVLRCGWHDCPAQQRAAPNPDHDCILLDHNLLDEVSNDLGSFRWGAIEGCRKAGCTSEHFAGLVARYAGCIQARVQHRRPGHCVAQDLDHSIFDLLGCQSPTLRAIGSGLGD